MMIKKAIIEWSKLRPWERNKAEQNVDICFSDPGMSKSALTLQHLWFSC
jgi:hypothetical protein